MSNPTPLHALTCGATAAAVAVAITGCGRGQIAAPPSGVIGVPRATAADAASARRAAEDFLEAFDTLDWESFRGALAEDMTMFFPFPGLAARVDGRTDVEELFSEFFEAQRGRRADAHLPMRMGIKPLDLRVQMAGPDAAVVSFHLGEESPSRRSLVLHRASAEDDRWEVVHWHASPAPATAEPVVVTHIPLSPAESAMYEGTYAYVSGGIPREMEVSGQDGRLIGEVRGGPRVTLQHQGDGEFIAHVGSATVRVEFAVEGGRATGMTIHQFGEEIPATRKTDAEDAADRRPDEASEPLDRPSDEG